MDASQFYAHLWLLFSFARNLEVRCFILLCLDDWSVHTALRCYLKLGKWMTNISKNLFICLSTHMSIVAIECFLHRITTLFLVFEPIDVSQYYSIMFGRFSQTNLMLRHITQRLIKAFLINNRFFCIC